MTSLFALPRGLHLQCYGDAAVLITAPGAVNAWERIHALADNLGAAQPHGIEGLVAAYDSLLVEFDPHALTRDDLDSHLQYAAAATAIRNTDARTHRIPALYGGHNGPDLDDVSNELGLTTAQFIEAHASAQWRVAFRGAPAASPALEGSPFDMPVPRCSQPRIRVPAGSVAVSNFQATIYAVDSPGGWRLIARTPLIVTDITRNPPVLYRPGDLFRFVPISEAEAQRHRGEFLGDADE